jgi:hypothetical protein
MPGRNSSISVAITGEADFKAAQADIEASFAKIEKASQASVDEVKQAFAKADVGITVDESGLTKATKDFDAFTAKLKAGSDVALTVDESDLLKAFDLADKLGKLTEQVTITADTDELKQAQQLAQSLRSFTGRINLDVQGQADLRDALGLAENLDQLRKVKIEVQGREDLARAGQIADDLERKRTIPIDAQLGDLKQLDTQLSAAGAEGGKGFGSTFKGALGETDLRDVGGSMASSLTGGLAVAGPWGAAAAVVAGVFADDFAAGFNDGWNSHKSDLFRTVTSGLDDATLRADGVSAGKAYSAGFGESLQQLKADADTLQSALGGLKGFIPDEALKQAEALKQTLGIEVVDSIRLVQRAVQQGLVPDVTSGFNLIGQAARDFGLDQQDLLQTFTEQSATFAQVGITGPRAIQLIGQAYTTGLIPQLDQTGELFETFVTALNTGTAKTAIEGLGLSWAQITSQLQSGKGAEAVDQVVAAIQRIPDPAQRSAVAVQLFGENLSLSANKDALLTLIGTAEEYKKLDPVATNAAKAVAESQTAFDQLTIAAERTGGALAGVANWLVLTAEAENTQILHDLKGAWDGVTGAVFGTDDSLQSLEDGLKNTTQSSSELIGTVAETDGKMRGLGDTADKAAGSIGNTALSVDDLQKTLDHLFNFSADQLLREIATQGDALAASFKDGAEKAVGLNGAIDITRKGGAGLQSQMEDLSGSLETATVKFVNGEISAAQFNQVQQAVESQFGRTTGAAHLTTAEIEGLRGKYLELPSSVTTTLIAHTGDAQNAIAQLQAALNNVHDKTVTITTRNAVINSLSVSTQLGRASGGPVKKGQIYKVGEQGQELFLPNQDGQIIDATSTKALLDRLAPSGLGGASVTVPVAGNSTKMVNFNGPIVVDKGRDLFADLLLYEQVYSAVA